MITRKKVTPVSLGNSSKIESFDGRIDLHLTVDVILANNLFEQRGSSVTCITQFSSMYNAVIHTSNALGMGSSLRVYTNFHFD